MIDRLLNILLIEDNPGDARLIQEILAETSYSGWDFTHVDSLKLGLQLLSEQEFDILLLDLNLPDCQGVETLTRALTHSPEIPVVLLTGLDSEEFALEAVRQGAQDYLVKGQFDGMSLVRTLSYAVERAMLLKEASRRATELETLANVGAALRTVESIAEMTQIVVQKAVEVVGNAFGSIFLVDLDEDELMSYGWYTSGEEKKEVDSICEGRLSHPIDEGITGYVYASGEVYISSDIQHDPKAVILPGESSILQYVYSSISLPLQTSEKIVGVMHIWLREKRAYTGSEIHLLTAISEMAANAFHRASLFEQTQQQLLRLSALRKIDEAIAAIKDLRLVLDVVVDQVISRLSVDAGFIYLWDSHALVLKHVSGRGIKNNGNQISHIKPRQGLIEDAVLKGELINIPNLAEAKAEIRPELHAEDAIAYFVVPLMAKGIVVGILEVFHRSVLEPDSEWLDFLETLAGQASIAIENATLFNDLQQSNQQLTLAYDATIAALSGALELRDIETQGHCHRVTEMTVNLARQMGINNSDLIHIRSGALLHDIGKIGISDDILLKPGQLTPQERSAMEKHPIYAYDMLSSISFLKPALEIPLYHHEKWDGNGYPHALVGHQIPIAARIFAIVDVWDALLSDRPYRKAWSEEEALAYIQDQSGIHFDPQVVKAFLELVTNTHTANAISAKVASRV